MCRRRRSPARGFVVFGAFALVTQYALVMYSANQALGQSKGRQRLSTAEVFAPGQPDVLEVERKLETRLVGVNFNETPLCECLKWIEEQIDVPILLCDAILDDAGVSRDEPVTLRLRYSAIRARRLLRLILEPLTLDYFVDGCVILITEPPCEPVQELRVYSCGDLLEEDGVTLEPEEKRARVAALVDVVCDFTPWPWEKLDGIGGSIWFFGDALVVLHSQYAHRDIRELLRQIRRAKRARHGRGTQFAGPSAREGCR